MLVAPGLVSTFGKALSFDSGRCVLTAAIMMAILIMPTIVSIAEDTLGNLPNSLRQGGEALGLTTMESVRKVVIPAAKPGLIGAGMLGFARALGETMIVWILAGGTPNMIPFSPRALVSPVRGIADTIGIEMANVEFEKPHYGHLFLIGLVLFLLTISINLYAQKVSRRALCRV
ncbi:MAG: ABC transporter permease subunit [Fimbriimonadaceae bacterium]